MIKKIEKILDRPLPDWIGDYKDLARFQSGLLKDAGIECPCGVAEPRAFSKWLDDLIWLDNVKSMAVPVNPPSKVTLADVWPKGTKL